MTRRCAMTLVSRVQSLFALARSRWRLAAFSVARVPPVRRAPCGLASHPAVLGPPSKDLGHATLRRGVIALAMAAIAMLAVAGPASAGTSPPARAAQVAAPAHPLGNATTNQYVGLRIGVDRIDIDYVLDLAELTAYRTCQEELHRACEPGSRGTPAEATRLCTPIARDLQPTVDQRRLRLSIDRAQLAFLAGVAGLSTARLECGLSARTSIAAGDRIHLDNDAYPGSIGWREVAATGAGLSLATSDVPATSASVRLTRYPTDLLSSPPDARTADVVAGQLTSAAASGRQAAGPPAPPIGERGQAGATAVAPRGLDRLSVAYTDLVSRHKLTLWFGTAALVAALLLGGLHAIAPGHGKTIMAAYLVSARGTARQAATIGLTVATTHTAGVLGLAILLTVASVAPERIYPWLGALSGVLLLMVGATLMISALRRGAGNHGHSHGRSHGHGHPAGHHHDHHHGHDRPGGQRHGSPEHEHGNHHRHEGHGHGDGDPAHEHGRHQLSREQSGARLPSGIAESAGQARPGLIPEVTGGGGHIGNVSPPKRRTLIGMGVIGGLVPSPSALLVLLGGIALGRPWFGFLLVVAYGLGLAATLTGIGLALARGAALLRAAQATNRLARLLSNIAATLPVITASLVVLVGLTALAKAMPGLS
jgi:nickel/cobalt transporter (NicO) family protein